MYYVSHSKNVQYTLNKVWDPQGSLIMLMIIKIEDMGILKKKVHYIWYLVSLTIWIYKVLCLSTIDVFVYMVRLLMFYNVQTTIEHLLVECEMYNK